MIRVAIAIVVLTAMASLARADAPSAYRCGDGKPDVGKGCTCPAGKRSARDAHDVAICAAAAATFDERVTPECRKDASRCFEVGMNAKDGPTATANLKAGCDRGDGDSCFGLVTGSAIDDGPRLTRHACELDSEMGCQAFFDSGLDEKQLPSLRKQFERACANGRCAGLAAMYLLGVGVPKDPDKAGDYFMRACKRRVRACDAAEDAYEKDRRSDAKLYGVREYLCKVVPANNCVRLAELIRVGRGTARDPAKALAVFEKYCRPDGDSDWQTWGACIALGEMAVAGEAMAVDVPRAISLYTKYCDRAIVTACEHLVDLHDRGLGEVQDPAKALAVILDACDRGRPVNACINVAKRYRDGIGVAKDPAKALKAARYACTFHIAEGCELEKQLEAKP